MDTQKLEYEAPRFEIFRMSPNHHLMEHSGETDQPMSKENMSWDDSEAPIFEVHHNKLWDE
jgi:hypothetical protein